MRMPSCPGGRSWGCGGLPRRCAAGRLRRSEALECPSKTGAIDSPERSERSERVKAKASELFQESNVVGEEVAQVVDTVAFLGEPVDAESEGEALPLFRVKSTVREHVGVDHAAPAELHVRAVGSDDV